MADQGTPWAIVDSPQNNFLGKSTTSGGRSVVDSVSSWNGAGSGVDSVSWMCSSILQVRSSVTVM